MMKTYKTRFAGFLLLALALCTWPGVASSSQADDEIIIVARNYFKTEPFNDGVVIRSKKDRFAPVKFMGVEGTAVLLFTYNRVSRERVIHLVSNLYKLDSAQVAPHVDIVLSFLRENNLVLQSQYPNPSINIGMAKFRI